MQDNYQFKQLGLVYESMVTRGPGGPPDPSSPNFGDKTMSIKLPIQGHGVVDLKYDRAALEPFLSKQNDSIEDFLAVIGVPDPDGPDPGPIALLRTRKDPTASNTVDYLVRMLNREFGTNFFYDDVDQLLGDGGEPDNEEDAEGSYM